MKCSLLTLSGFVDGELDARRRGELEAHLVGCRRCQGGVQHLREEIARVGALPQLRVPDTSVAELLEELHLIPAGAPLPERQHFMAPRRAADPWLGGEVGAALPWRADHNATGHATRPRSESEA